MKIFFKILSYSNKPTTRLILFFGYSFLGSVFGAFNVVLVLPLLEVLFKTTNGEVVVPALPEFSFSAHFIITYFQHYFLGIIRDYGFQSALLFVCGLLIVSRLATNIFVYLERIIATKIRVDLVRNLRMALFESVSKLDIGYFNSKRKGDLISRFTNDLQETETAVMNTLKAVFKEPVAIIISFVFLFYLSATLTFFTLLVLPLTGGFLAFIIRRLKSPALQSQESLGRIVNLLDETFGGMRVVKAFNATKFVVKKMNDESAFYRKVSKSVSYKNESSAPVSEFLGVLTIAGLIYFAGNMVVAQGSDFSAAALITFLTFFATIIQPIKNFSNGITSLQKGTISAGRIFDVVDTEPAVKDKPNAVEIKNFENEIEFRNVSFAYESELVLKNINLTVKKGKMVALVGTSGGGKSTLADLIPRFYDPTSGEVCLDGISLRDYTTESLRQQMGIVTQESILFNDTIANNISFGMEKVDRNAVIAAAKIANAHEFIMQTEHGYETAIGERGSKLSGGQRQRLSIARAVLKNPPILILDEATSALDSESEKLVQEALFNLMKNRTSIVIAHRLSTIQHADEIIVIQQGEIVERGSHDELIRNGGLYQKLSTIQK